MKTYNFKVNNLTIEEMLENAYNSISEVFKNENQTEGGLMMEKDGTVYLVEPSATGTYKKMYGDSIIVNSCEMAQEPVDESGAIKAAENEIEYRFESEPITNYPNE